MPFFFFVFAAGQRPRHHHGRRAGVFLPPQHHREAALWPGRYDTVWKSPRWVHTDSWDHARLSWESHCRTYIMHFTGKVKALHSKSKSVDFFFFFFFFSLAYHHDVIVDCTMQRGCRVTTHSAFRLVPHKLCSQRALSSVKSSLTKSLASEIFQCLKYRS